MPVEINMPSRFLLNQIKAVDNNSWLKLPSIDLIHRHEDPANILTIRNINCFVKGNPQILEFQIQQAYNYSFNSYHTPFKLDSLIRFSPYCLLSAPLPLNLKYYLGINVDYLEEYKSISSLKTAKKNCYLFHQTYKEEDEMPKHEGWVAIDFGTSNSTVTFYDPKEGTEPNELSQEQKNLFFKLFEEWLGSSSSNCLPGISDSDWNQFIDQVNSKLEKPWSDIIANKNSSNLFEGIRQLEISLGSRLDDPLYPVVSKKINEIYRQVFQLPPLQKERIVIAEIGKNEPDPTQIISELELTNVSSFLDVRMGKEARDNRLSSISQNSGENQEERWQEIESKFHHSPKRYLNQNRKDKEEEKIDIYWEGEKKKIEYSELIQAAIKCLINLTEEFKDDKRNRKRCSSGNFYRVVITYPTIAKPGVRRKLEDLVRQIIDQKFSDSDVKVDVKRDFDEAIAAAIFYLWREFGGNQTIGLEAFKTRCRRSGQKWAQNLLVLDIGGGTTDLALIRLLLEEVNPFQPGEDRGAGGRYYILTPELMGSSGHLYLGGELITLRVFRLLKVLIVDKLLTAVTEGKLENDRLNRIIQGIDTKFRQEQSKYLSNSFLECIDKENPESDSFYETVLNYTEQVLPTRWKENGTYLQTFTQIWEWSEDAKVKLSGGVSEYEISQEKLETFLLNSDIDISASEYNFSVKLSKQQLERASSRVIQEAINIAKELLESRLPKDESTNKKEPLDWLILSGQTCRLDLVERMLNQTFSKSELDWNPARITFVPEYAKLATSIGACYGMSLQQYAFYPEGAKDKLKKGQSELYIQVKNLLYTLPCSFERKVQGISETIFNPRQPLYQFKPNEEAKARSKWLAVQPTITVDRRDFDSQKPVPWANFVFEELAKKIGVYSDNFEYYNPYQVQFEVNQTLEIEMLVCRGNPHYQVDTNSPKLKNINKKISEELSKENTEEKVSQNIIVDSVIQWEVAVGVNEESPHIVFSSGEELNEVFHYSETGKEQILHGAISKNKDGQPLPLPPFPRGAKHSFYAYYPSLANPILKPIPLGVLGFEENKIKENFRYYLTIDEQGVLRLHEGEVPYWTSDNPELLKEQEGYVLRIKPNPIQEENSDEQNPFSGTH